ncbi:MAG TPA: prefoldin subunit alpha [Nanoarchaeota archaeon]|nr:prefoldin subunit alpha [Nanoarchaeota archaeon]
MKEIEKKLVEFQMLKALYEQLEVKERELFENKMEMEISLNAIKEISSIENSAEVFVNFGAGNYIKGKIYAPEKILVSIGAGIVVEKSIKDAITLMEERIKNIEQTINQIKNEKEKIALKLEAVKEEIENIQKSEK